MSRRARSTPEASGLSAHPFRSILGIDRDDRPWVDSNDRPWTACVEPVERSGGKPCLQSREADTRTAFSPDDARALVRAVAEALSGG